MLLERLAKNWWTVALRGVLAILFGVIALARPGITLSVLVLLFGAYAIADGIFALAAALTGGSGRPWWALVLKAMVSLAAGAITFLLPGLTAMALLWVIAFWAIVLGAMEIMVAIRLRKEIKGEMFLVLSGALSVLFGILLIARPGAGALALTWMIGAYAIGFGLLLIALSFRLKGLRNTLKAASA